MVKKSEAMASLCSIIDSLIEDEDKAMKEYLRISSEFGKESLEEGIEESRIISMVIDMIGSDEGEHYSKLLELKHSLCESEIYK